MDECYLVTVEESIAQVGCKYHLIRYTVFGNVGDKKRLTRGRSKKDDCKEKETFYKVDIRPERNQALVGKKKKVAVIFVLIRNEIDEEKLSDLEVLKEYKQQHSV